MLRSRKFAAVLLTAFVSIGFGFHPGLARADLFVRGDVDGTGGFDISDAINIFLHLFAENGPTLECKDAADTNDSGAIDIADGIYLLNYLFAGGRAPPPPHDACGMDLTDDKLDCRSFPACRQPDASLYELKYTDVVCLVPPCFNWSAIHDDTVTEFSDLDLSPLGLSHEEETVVEEQLKSGMWMVNGLLIEGPEGPAGMGRTMMVYELVPEHGTLFHVISNGIVCVTHPCFSWTVRNADAEFDVSDIDLSRLNLEPEEEARLWETLASGRAVVRGVVIDGPKGPAGLGKTLVVFEVLLNGGSPYYVFDNGIVCVRAPCPSWTAQGGSPEGEPTNQADFSTLELAPLGLSAEREATVRAQLRDGELLVRGFLGGESKADPGLRTLVVLEIINDTAGRPYAVSSSGIVCVTWPCPIWSALPLAGEPAEPILFTDLELRPLGLLSTDATKLSEKIRTGGVANVRGEFVAGPIGPAGLGTTLVVLELLD